MSASPAVRLAPIPDRWRDSFVDYVRTFVGLSSSPARTARRGGRLEFAELVLPRAIEGDGREALLDSITKPAEGSALVAFALMRATGIAHRLLLTRWHDTTIPPADRIGPLSKLTAIGSHAAASRDFRERHKFIHTERPLRLPMAGDFYAARDMHEAITFGAIVDSRIVLGRLGDPEDPPSMFWLQVVEGVFVGGHLSIVERQHTWEALSLRDGWMVDRERFQVSAGRVLVHFEGFAFFEWEQKKKKESRR